MPDVHSHQRLAARSFEFAVQDNDDRVKAFWGITFPSVKSRAATEEPVRRQRSSLESCAAGWALHLCKTDPAGLSKESPPAITLSEWLLTPNASDGDPLQERSLASDPAWEEVMFARAEQAQRASVRRRLANIIGFGRLLYFLPVAFLKRSSYSSHNHSRTGTL